jgi:DNA-binding MarR family transcriptional regulator
MAVRTEPIPDLGFLFNHAGHVVNTELTAKLAELGTTPREICVLGKALGAELTQSRLGELAALDKTTMVVTMDALERAGLAERRPSATDRRARIVAVTPAGEELLAAGQQVVDQAHLDMLAALPAADREVFVRCMSALVGDRLAKPAEGTRPVRRRR